MFARAPEPVEWRAPEGCRSSPVAAPGSAPPGPEGKQPRHGVNAVPCRGGAGEGEHIQFSQEDFLGFGASGKRGCSARPASSLTLSRSPEHTVWRPAGAALPGAASKSILSGRARGCRESALVGVR